MVVVRSDSRKKKLSKKIITLSENHLFIKTVHLKSVYGTIYSWSGVKESYLGQSALQESIAILLNGMINAQNCWTLTRYGVFLRDVFEVFNKDDAHATGSYFSTCL